MSIVGAAGYPRPIIDTSVQNGAGNEGLQEKTLNAGNQWLAEYVGGAKVSDTVQSIAPPTPMHGYMLPGHDHSGGIMGVPQRHTVFCQAFGIDDQTNITNEDAPLEIESSEGPKSLADCWVGPLFIPGGKAYQQLEVEFLLKVSTSGVGYTIEVTNAETGPVSTSGTLSTGETWVVLSDYLTMIPGKMNLIRLRIDVTNDGGPSSGTLRLLCMNLNQTSNTP